MPKVNGLSDQAVAQLMELFRREQMRLIPPPIPTQRRRRIYAANEGVPFINESGETVPPYGVMEVVSIDANGIVHITKPTSRRESIYLVNRGVAVLDNYQGVGDYGFDKPIPVLATGAVYDYEDDNPQSDGAAARAKIVESFAPQPGYWHLRSVSVEDFNTEDIGFNRCVGYAGFSLTDYEYDYGEQPNAVMPEYAVIYYFMQQLEVPEASITLPVSDESMYKDYTTNVTLIGNAGADSSYLRISDSYHDIHTMQFSRIGVLTRDPTTGDEYNLKIFRAGLYQIDVQISVMIEGVLDGDTRWFTKDVTLDAPTGSPDGHWYDRLNIQRFRGGTITLIAQSTLGNFVHGTNSSTATLFIPTHSNDEPTHVLRHTFEFLGAASEEAYPYDPTDAAYGVRFRIQWSDATGFAREAYCLGGTIKIKRLRGKMFVKE